MLVSKLKSYFNYPVSGNWLGLKKWCLEVRAKPEVSATSDYGKQQIKYCSFKLWISEKNKNGKKLIDYVSLLMLTLNNHINLLQNDLFPNWNFRSSNCAYTTTVIKSIPLVAGHPLSSTFPSTFPRIIDFSRELGLCLEYDTLSLAKWELRINLFYQYDLSVCFLGYTWYSQKLSQT